MARERVLKVTVLGDASSASRALHTLNADAAMTQSKLKSFGSKVRSAFFIAAPAIAAVGAGLGFMVKEAAEAQKVADQTKAVIKSTGGVANVTKQEVASLAETIRDYSGISDETVASAENLLLTFTDIRDEVGKGNNIFKQATKISADLSVALGQDMTESAKLVGKALNDPIRGMSALRRVGVSFSEKQEAVITKMVETGDKMGAQKEILEELRKEYGNSAEAAGDTFAGKLEILKGKFGDIAERIGKKLLPYLEDFADWLTEHLPEIMETAGKILGQIRDVFVSVYRAVSATVQAIKDLRNAVDDALGPLDEFLGKISRIPLVSNLLKASPLEALVPSWVRDVVGLIPGLASGGPAQANRPYIVGERGPELFVPQTSGRVIPNGAMGGGSITLNVDGRRINRWTARDNVLLGNA